MKSNDAVAMQASALKEKAEAQQAKAAAQAKASNALFGILLNSLSKMIEPKVATMPKEAGMSTPDKARSIVEPILRRFDE